MTFAIGLSLSEWEMSAFKKSHETTTSKMSYSFFSTVIDIQNDSVFMCVLFSRVMMLMLSFKEVKKEHL